MAKILVVDDDPEFLHFLKLFLRHYSHDVVAATDGGQALKVLEEESPDLIISDIQMEGMDGWEFFQNVRLQPSTAAIPFIFLTGMKSLPDRVCGLRMGADDFVTKPFSGEEFLARIEGCLERRRKRGEFLMGAVPGGVFGHLGPLSLIDIVQVMEVNRRSSVVSLKQGTNVGKIYLRDGNIIGVCLNGDSHPYHFYTLLHWEDAEFCVGPYVDDLPMGARGVHTVRKLILEGARLHDEAQQGKRSDPDPLQGC